MKLWSARWKTTLEAECWVYFSALKILEGLFKNSRILKKSQDFFTILGQGNRQLPSVAARGYDSFRQVFHAGENDKHSRARYI